jgi:hypothetical protein
MVNPWWVGGGRGGEAEAPEAAGTAEGVPVLLQRHHLPVS